VPVEVPKSLRSPSLRPTLTTKGPKVKKDKQKVAQPVRTFPRKHLQKDKPTAQEKGKVVNLESEEGTEDVDMGARTLTLRT